MPSKKLHSLNFRSGAPMILSAVLLLSIGFVLGSIVTSVHGFVPVTFTNDTREQNPTVYVQGMRNGVLLGDIKGGAQFVAGDDIVTPDGSGAFAIKNPSICIDTVTISVPAGMPFVASRKGKKYYPVESPSAQRLTPENRVYFPDAASAEKAGYVR